MRGGGWLGVAAQQDLAAVGGQVHVDHHDRRELFRNRSHRQAAGMFERSR